MYFTTAQSIRITLAGIGEVSEMSNVYDFNGDFVKILGLKVPWLSDSHRGHSTATICENTLPAYYLAWLNGTDWIESDARLASDGVYVVYHDATVTVGGITYTIANETSETLTALVLSTDPVYGDCKIPTLESVLKLALYTGMNVNLDCKAINPATLAKLVVDCGMSGRVYYANTLTSNASAILAVDPNAGFLFNYSADALTTWASALPDYHTRQRSFAWASTISNEALEATRSLGFKYLLSEVNSTALMYFAPDVIEFVATANCGELNDAYLSSIDLPGT